MRTIGHFSQAGLHEWMPFVIFRARSREKLQLPLPGRFLSITVEVEPRIVKQYICHYGCVCKYYRGKVTEAGKKGVLSLFFGWPDDRECRRGFLFALWHSITRTTSYCLFADTLWLRSFKNTFKVGIVNFANSLSSPSIAKKVLTGKSRELTINPTWTAQ